MSICPVHNPKTLIESFLLGICTCAVPVPTCLMDLLPVLPVLPVTNVRAVPMKPFMVESCTCTSSLDCRNGKRCLEMDRGCISRAVSSWADEAVKLKYSNIRTMVDLA